MTAAAKPKTDPYRRQLLGKVHIAKTALGLDDDTYRDLLEARTGKRSAAKCSNAQLVDLVEHFKAQGFKPKVKAPARARRASLADSRTQRKARALWLSLYHLGLVGDPSEPALSSFVKRQARVDDVRFLTPGQSYKVIEALKAWAARPLDQGGAGVDWRLVPVYDHETRILCDQDRPRVRVIEAQWRRLIDLGVFRTGNFARLDTWLRTNFGVAAPVYLTAEQADACIERLGSWIRREKGKAGR